MRTSLREEIVDKLLDVDEEIDILFKALTAIRWLSYDPNMLLGTFKRVSMGSDRHLTLQSPTEPNAFLSIDQETFFANLMATTTVHQKAMTAVGPASLTKVKGLPDTIDPTRPPKSFRDAMQREVERCGRCPLRGEKSTGKTVTACCFRVNLLRVCEEKAAVSCAIYGAGAYNQYTAKHKLCLSGSNWTRARSNSRVGPARAGSRLRDPGRDRIESPYGRAGSLSGPPPMLQPTGGPFRSDSERTLFFPSHYVP
jgi:hypothetical protein